MRKIPMAYVSLAQSIRQVAVSLLLALGIASIWLADLPSLHVGPPARAAEGQQSQIPQDEFEQRVRNYLLAHPEVIGEALSRLEAKQGEQQAAAAKAALTSHEEQALFLRYLPNHSTAGRSTIARQG
jgi:hypothetical protein